MQITAKEQIETPALLLDLDILEANIRKMSEYMRDKPAKLRPHCKTHKCPAIAHMQMAAGAKGITCAKLGEAEVMAKAGIQDILIANQTVDAVKISRLAALAHNARMTVCVDNAQNIAALSQAAAAYHSTIYVLIEIEVGMNRCGVNTKEETLVLAKQIRQSAGLVFEGLQAYAGHLSHQPDRRKRIEGLQSVYQKVGEIKAYLESHGVPVKEISGAGTGTYDITGEHTIWTELQAGSYVFMDTEYAGLGLAFQQALSVLTTVIHKRPGFAVTDAGLKSCSTDQGLPSLRDYPQIAITLNEEHGILKDTEDALAYLQKLEYAPAHCCSIVNLYDEFHCIRNGIWEMTWPISARGKSR